MPPAEQSPNTPPPIDHVFVLLLENQTFDRVFGSFPGADGDASQKHVIPDAPGWVPNFEPTHGVLSFRLRRVFANVFFRGQHLESDRPLWWRWARDYVLADRHRTQAGPSTPNHMGLIAATSAGLQNNPNPIAILRWLQTTPNSKQPPFDVFTLPNRLEAAGISWANYGDIDFNYFTQLADPGNPGKARNTHATDQFFADAAAGTLPSVNWVYADDPGKQDGLGGMEWTRRVVEAIKAAPGDLWSRSAIFITWDDWGGFYDHVQPVDGEAPAGFVQGGRVPLLIMSPYAKPAHVFHEPTIHASVVRFIGKLFGLQPLNAVDAGANDLMGAFDFSQAPLPAPDTSPLLVPSTLPSPKETELRGFGLRPRALPGRSLG